MVTMLGYGKSLEKMMRTAIMMLTYLTLTIFSADASKANDALVQAQIEEIALVIVERLNVEEKIVLKTISPEDSGLPEEFLRKISADFESALLVQSEFRIRLTNRFSTEDLWAEAVEFGDADFEELYTASQADIMLLMSPRVSAAGLEVSVTAYELLGENSGQVVAASGSVLLAVDLEATLGIDVITITDQVNNILEEIEVVTQAGGVISNPTTYAQFYHNSRMYQQRGEVGLALNNLEAALKLSPFPFIDPVEDFVNLAVSQYGGNAGVFLEQRVKGNISDDLYDFAYWLLFPSTDAISVADLSGDDKPLLPLVALWLSQNVKGLEERIREGDANGAVAYTDLFLLLEAGRYVLSELSSGGLQSFYIDKSRVKDIIDSNSLRNLINEFNRVEYAYFETDYVYGTGGRYVNYTDCFLRIDDFECESLVGSSSVVGGVPGYPMLMDIEMPDHRLLRELILEELPRFRLIDFARIFPASPDGENQTIEVAIPGAVSGSSVERRLGPCGTNINLNDLSRKPLDRVNPVRFQDFTEEVVGNDWGVYPMNAAMDRLIFADLCIEAQLASESSDRSQFSQFLESASSSLFYFNPSNFEGLQGISASNKIHGIKGLLITDNVDTSREIIYSYSLDETWAVAGGVLSSPVYGAVDISRDGSYISPIGAQFPSGRSVDGQELLSYIALPNGWLYVPGVVQGAVGLNRPQFLSVTYFDQSGRRQVIRNSYLSTRGIDGVYIGAYGEPSADFNGEMFVGYYAPISPFGLAVSPECASREQFSSSCEPRMTVQESDGLRETLCAEKQCVLGIGLEAISSFSLVREVLYGGIRAHHDEQVQNSPTTGQSAAVPNAQPQWRLVSSYAGPFHLGDEDVSSWPPLVGRCFSFELPAIVAGGTFAFTIEPYGLERAFFRFADGSEFDIPSQAVISGSRPNYWGESNGLSFDFPSGSLSEMVAICSDQLDASDYDDFMFRNLEVWTYQ